MSIINEVDLEDYIIGFLDEKIVTQGDGRMVAEEIINKVRELDFSNASNED